MIHVQLAADVEARLRAQARARGIEADRYLGALIEDVVRAAPIVTGRSAEGRNIGTFLDAMSEDSECLPRLPDEAFTRARFYGDHA
jgi:hypothetical protein